MQVSGKKLVLGLVSWLFFSLFCNAQDIQTTQNLVQPYGWEGCLTQHNGMIWAGTSGGPCPVQRSGDGAILFSYGTGLLYQTVAVNQALLGTGIQVRGYDYGWTIKNANAGVNQNPSYDPLSITVRLYDNTNKNIIETKKYDYDRRINDWTRFTGTENFANPYSLSSLGNLQISMSGRDAGGWAGYYGAEINNIDVRLRYSVDPCGSNPLASPTCEGYQQAFLQQQCAISPLYSQSCPGWQQAWFNQQCVTNPLYGSSCPGYAAAYQAQQCSLNQLFSPLCPEYQQAYFNQQCIANPLYNSGCPGYAKALFDKTCNENPLSNTSCPLYESAYLNQQCSINPLFSTSCPLYQQAYFNQQCTANPLYNSGCQGYANAFKEKQVTDACKSNSQSSPQCAGYSSPSFSTNQSNSLIDTNKLAEPALVTDPQAQQVITPPSLTSTTSPVSQINTSPQLGTGLTVSGFTPQPTTQQQRQAQAAQAQRAERAKQDPQQQQQAKQIAQMGTVPGFDQYQQANLPDAVFYTSKEIYRNRTLPDNPRAQRALSQRSDRLHQEMIDEQYRK